MTKVKSSFIKLLTVLSIMMRRKFGTFRKENRMKDNTKILTYRMPIDLYEEFVLIKNATGIPIAQLIVIALWEKIGWNNLSNTKS